jgi:hypothetical protein
MGSQAHPPLTLRPGLVVVYRRADALGGGWSPRPAVVAPFASADPREVFVFDGCTVAGGLYVSWRAAILISAETIEYAFDPDDPTFIP